MRNKLIPLLIIPTFLTGCNLSKWEDINQTRALEIINNIGTYYSKHQPHHLISYTIESKTETNLETGESNVNGFNVIFHQYDIDQQIDSKINARILGGFSFDLSFVLVVDNSLYHITTTNNFNNYYVDVPLFNSDQDTIKEYFHEQIFPGINPCCYFLNIIDSLNKVNLYREISKTYYQESIIINGTSVLSSKNNQSLKANTKYYSSIEIVRPEEMIDIKPGHNEYTLTFDNNRCLGYTSKTTTQKGETLNTTTINCIFDYDTPAGGLITTDYLSQITEKELITNIAKMIDEKLANLFKKDN
ncbi:MAG: hypothetical protein MJ208_02640 [Bacilli bacterium]|nr:hypothetical protein [Bacilli bacterium]